MTETLSEDTYSLVGDLARARIALDILRRCYGSDARQPQRLLDEWVLALEARVASLDIRGEEPG